MTQRDLPDNSMGNIAFRRYGRGTTNTSTDRHPEVHTLACAAIRYRGFLAEVTDLSEVRGLPRGTSMTLHTYDSNWFDRVGKLPDVWQIDTNSGTVLSYAQTTEAWRKHRKRGIIVFSIMASVIFLLFCSADLISDRTERARNTPWPYRGR